MMGIAKALFALDAKTSQNGDAVLDRGFIAEHTHGFDEFAGAVKASDWDQIERRSGLTRGALEAAAAVYAHAKSVMFIYGMGLTQHKKGVETVQTLVNLALMRGNIGRPGAGICPVRGHSNVQGQRTVGITEKPEQGAGRKAEAAVWHRRAAEEGRQHRRGLRENHRRQRPRGGAAWRQSGSRRSRASLDRAGLAQAAADRPDPDEAQPHGAGARRGVLYPALSRPHRDRSAGQRTASGLDGGQHRLHARLARPGEAGQSRICCRKPKIVAELAKAAVPGRLDRFRGMIGSPTTARSGTRSPQTYPEIFHDFNARLWKPGGFHRPVGARQAPMENQDRKGQFHRADLARRPTSTFHRNSATSCNS